MITRNHTPACILCGEIPRKGEAWHTDMYRTIIISCDNCYPVVKRLFKDYSKSKHGRRRSFAEFLKAVEESRHIPRTPRIAMEFPWRIKIRELMD